MAGTDGITNVTFAAGAPLDPDDLNILQSNIQKVSTTASLYNQTISGLKTVPSIQSGTFPVTGINSKTAVAQTLPKFTGDPQIFFTIHQSSSITATTWVSVTVDKTVSPWKAYFRTNASSSFSTNVDWVAVEMVPVA